MIIYTDESEIENKIGAIIYIPMMKQSINILERQTKYNVFAVKISALSLIAGVIQKNEYCTEYIIYSDSRNVIETIINSRY